ncbi:unnamed protein product [Linum trigynum]
MGTGGTAAMSTVDINLFEARVNSCFSKETVREEMVAAGVDPSTTAGVGVVAVVSYSLKHLRRSWVDWMKLSS